MYVYNNYDDYNNEIMEAFDTVYTNVQASVKNADEIEWTVDALYSGWFHINAFFCLGICTGNVFGDKLSEMKEMLLKRLHSIRVAFFLHQRMEKE